jgi:hypothetical protein
MSTKSIWHLHGNAVSGMVTTTAVKPTRQMSLDEAGLCSADNHSCRRLAGKKAAVA